MTAQGAVTEAQTTYGDMPDTMGLVLCQSVHDDLCIEYPLIPATVDIVTLVAGTATYAIAQDVVGVRAAAYFRSSGQDDYIALEPRDADELDVLQPGWRYRQSAVPWAFVLDGGNIRLVDAPDTSTVLVAAPDASTVVGYPFVRCECLKSSTLVGATVLPSSVPNHQLYANGIRMKWAEKRDKANFGLWNSIYQDNLKLLNKYLGKRNRRFVAQQTPESYTLSAI